MGKFPCSKVGPRGREWTAKARCCCRHWGNRLPSPRTMVGKITFYTLRHRAIVLALTVLFTIAGINAFRRLPVEAYPDVTNISVQVITLFPGHAAEEVERLVTIPIENQMNGIPKRTSIRSIS